MAGPRTRTATTDWARGLASLDQQACTSGRVTSDKPRQAKGRRDERAAAVDPVLGPVRSPPGPGWSTVADGQLLDKSAWGGACIITGGHD